MPYKFFMGFFSYMSYFLNDCAKTFFNPTSWAASYACLMLGFSFSGEANAQQANADNEVIVLEVPAIDYLSIELENSRHGWEANARAGTTFANLNPIESNRYNPNLDTLDQRDSKLEIMVRSSGRWSFELDSEHWDPPGIPGNDVYARFRLENYEGEAVDVAGLVHLDLGEIGPNGARVICEQKSTGIISPKLELESGPGFCSSGRRNHNPRSQLDGDFPMAMGVTFDADINNRTSHNPILARNSFGVIPPGLYELDVVLTVSH